MAKANPKNYVMLTIVAIVVVVAFVLLIQPKDTPGTRLGNAMDEMADGIDDAADELKPNKTPAEKLGDAVEDVGDSIEDAAD